MLGKTHKAGGCLAMLLAYQYLQSKGLLVDTIHPIIQLLVMYPACSWGSTAPDLDQGENAIPEKTPVSLLVHKIIHIGKVRHRSWQTHSLFVTGGLVALMFVGLYFINLYGLFNLNAVSMTILRLLFMGVTVGIASHLILDAFTYQGIPLGPPAKGKQKWLRLVPHTDAFKTNTTYEKIVRVLLYLAIILDILYQIIF